MLNITVNLINRCTDRGHCVLYRHRDLTADITDNAEGRKSNSVSPFFMFALSNQNTVSHIISLAAKATFLFCNICGEKKIPCHEVQVSLQSICI